MERGKTSSAGRGAKSKAPQHPQDIFALGSKSTVVVSRDSEKRNIHKPSTSGVERKRETSGFGSQPPSKRARIGSPAEAVGGTSLEVDPVDLVPNVLQALDTHNSDKLLGLLTGSIRLLKSQRSKPDPILCMSMLYLVKIRPNMFAHETVTQTLCTLLKREHGAAFKSKGNPLVYILACNMLYAGHRDSNNWPDIFIKVYIEDALNERWWVDCSWCKCLVENIVTAFNTKKPPSHLLPSDNTMGTMSPSGSGSPSMGTSEDDVDNNDLEYSVYPRYSASYETVEAMVLEAIKDQIQRRAAPDAIGKGFLKLLSATCGLPEIRMIAASRLEAWLHSGKLWRNAQELLCSVCVNVGASVRDHDALAQLARMRLKTKPLQNAYHAALREMVSDNPTLLRSVVTHTIFNELSNVRAPNNMAVLSTLLVAQPMLLPAAMAQTYQELLFRTDDYLRPLRLLTRECMRAARPDALKLLPLATALASRPVTPPPAAIRERAFLSTVDLICVIALCAASSRADVRSALPALQAQVLAWMQDCLPLYKPSKQAYALALNKIMFLEGGESYSKLDNWPGESERGALLRACSDTPLTSNVLLLLLQHKDTPISATEVFDLIEQLVRRACALPPEDNPIQVDKLKIVDYIFQLCMFTPPENITFPQGYTPPQLLITSMVWRAWIILTMIAAHNPDSFAAKAASMYPTLRSLIETCITNKPSIEWNAATDAEMAETEKVAILQYETHLAAATNKMAPPITEHTSRLLSQLTLCNLTGAARRPSAGVLEALQQWSAQTKLGRLLCRQRALLLALVERHGTKRAMPWLHHILAHEPQQLSVLPVQCVCEFVCAGGAAGGAPGEGGGARAGELVAHVRRVLLGAAGGARAVLHYYCCRLAHAQRDQRANARTGLKLVLATPIEEVADYDFSVDVNPDEFLDLMWELPHWDEVRDEIMVHIRSAVLVECIPKHVASYIVAIARYVRETPGADHTHIVLELSQALMERSTVMNYVLPSDDKGTPAQHAALHAITYVLHGYAYHLRENNITSAPPLDPESVWAGVARVVLQWRTHACCMHLLAAHAQLKLLHTSPSHLDTNQEMYNYLESIWVGSDSPTAYTLETMEETELIPDWLRLHMVRSAKPKLLAAGIKGLPAHKLALFIQTFGMPVASMSALLKALDACPAGAISRLCVERGYMAQLLRVQRARGAQGGQAFAAALPLQPPAPTVAAEVPTFDDDKPVAPIGRRPRSTYKPDENMVLLAQVTAELSSRGPGARTAALLSRLSAHAQEPRALPAAELAPLLAVLLQLQPPPRELAKALLHKYKYQRGPVTDILRKIIGDDVKTGGVIAPGRNASRSAIIAAFEAATASSLEAIGQRVIKQQPDLAIDVITHLLQNSASGKYDQKVKLEDGSTESHIFSSKGRGCGLLLDWLSELQPEIVGEDPYRQLVLMFRSYRAAWRPLLATALTHRASWRCLQACLAQLLDHSSEWEPDAVLQFMETLINSERIHQNKSAPCPLKISRKQLRALVRWVTEGAGAGGAEGAEDDARTSRLQRRAHVLLRVPEAHTALLALKLPPVRKDLREEELARNFTDPKSEKLLSESYERPRWRGAAAGEAAAPALTAGAPTDVPSHTLLTALAHRHKNWRLEAALRSLWTYAEGAGRRALPLAAALLRAAPAPTRPPQPILAALETLPDSELFPPHCPESGRIMESLILCAGAAAAAGGAREQPGLHRAAALLRRCAGAAPPPVPALQALQRHHALLQSIPALSGVAAGSAAGAASSSAPPHALQAVEARADVTAATLQELESWGSRRGGQWGGARTARQLAAAVSPLLAEPALSSAAAALLERLLPATADRQPCMRVILECLDSDQPEIAQNILDRLPDLLICMQEHATLILSKVFEYGIKSRYPVEQCISKCITNINMQRGC